MIVGDLSIRGRGISTREARIRSDAVRTTLRQLKSAGALDDSRATAALVDTTGKADAFTWNLERTRQQGQPLADRLDLDYLQDQFFELWHIEPIVKHGINFLTTLMLGGGGPVIEWKEDAPKEWAAQWTEFDSNNHYSDRLVPQAIHDKLLYGEGGMIHPDRKGPNDASEKAFWLDPVQEGGGGFAGPDKVVDPTVFKTKGGRAGSDIPLHQCTHYRTFTTGNQKRGRPILEAAFPDIWMIRTVMNSGVLLQEYLQRVLAFTYKLNDSERGEQVETALKNGSLSITAPRPLEPYVVPAGADMEFHELGDRLFAGDKYSRGPEYLPMIRTAWSLGIPVHLLRLEFNEANYASLLSADGPTVAQAKRLIKYARPSVHEDVEKVVPKATARKHFVAKWPPLIMRDEHKHIEVWTQAQANGHLSDESYHRELGLDPDDERQRLDADYARELALAEKRRAALRDGRTEQTGDGGAVGQG